jgi:hypothetical protein
VWDAVTKQLVWKAKNVPHDEVRLEVPIWITGIAFMPSGANASPNDCAGNVIATGTGHKHIRMYDTRMQRQPCQSWGMGDFRVTAVVPSYQHEQHLYVADCAGGILMYDMRNGRRIRTLNGFDGSVRDIAHNVSLCYSLMLLEHVHSTAAGVYLFHAGESGITHDSRFSRPLRESVRLPQPEEYFPSLPEE